jgi:nucleoid DNA-binding protein
MEKASKQNLIQLLAARLEITKTDATTIHDIFIDIIEENLNAGVAVNLKGIGKLFPHQTKERVVHCGLDGNRYKTDGKFTIRFKASKGV